MSLGQSTSNSTVKLEDIIFDVNKVSDFLRSDFKSFKPVEGEARFEQEYLDGDHPFDLEKLNREIASTTIKYTFFGLPATNICAYIIDQDKFALYFIVYLDRETITKIINRVGPPINLYEHELSHPEDQFLIDWPFEAIDVMASRPSFGSYKKRWSIIVRTRNVYHGEFSILHK